MYVALIRVVLASAGMRPQHSAIFPATDDNIELLLHNFHVIHFRDHTDRLAAKSEKTLNQCFGVLAAHVYLISFVEFLHIFVFVHEKVGCQAPLWICPWKQAQPASCVILEHRWQRAQQEQDFELSGAASSICVTSLSSSCSDITYILAKNFDSERVVQGEDEQKIFRFSALPSLLCTLWGTTRRNSLQRWLSWICLRGCKTRRWQPRFHRMVLKCRTQTLMPACPVLPFTSFMAVKWSKTTSVFVPWEKQLLTLSQSSTSSCGQLMTQLYKL